MRALAAQALAQRVRMIQTEPAAVRFYKFDPNFARGL